MSQQNSHDMPDALPVDTVVFRVEDGLVVYHARFDSFGAALEPAGIQQT